MVALPGPKRGFNQPGLPDAGGGQRPGPHGSDPGQIQTATGEVKCLSSPHEAPAGVLSQAQ